MFRIPEDSPQGKQKQDDYENNFIFNDLFGDDRKCVSTTQK